MSAPKMHSELYKDRLLHSKEARQAERRDLLLVEQRKKRNELKDESRHLEENPAQKSKYVIPMRRDKPQIRNKLQLSEWWMDRPDDLEDWIARPCPKGVRCLVVATNGRTQVFNKRGGFMTGFTSELPGCHRNKATTTMLDCVYVLDTSTFYVLDVIVYKDQDLRDCDASFRFFWIKSKLEEERLDQVTHQNQRSFQWIETSCCESESALNSLMAKHPIWPSNVPQLDGILFYHKESAYVAGETPLVLWLFAFMLPEILFVPDMHEAYLLDKPANYTNYLDYIDEFNRKMKKRNRRSKCDMECEEMDTNVVNEQMNLELETSENDDANHHLEEENVVG